MNAYRILVLTWVCVLTCLVPLAAIVHLDLQVRIVERHNKVF